MFEYVLNLVLSFMVIIINKITRVINNEYADQELSQK